MKTAIVALVLATATASAAPWRAGLVVRYDWLHSSSEIGPVLTATAGTLGLSGERQLARRWWARAVIEGGLGGPVAIDALSVEKTSLAFASLVVGVAHTMGRGWYVRGGIGVARMLFLSPRVIGDSGWSPVVGGELAHRNDRWWRGEVGLRVLAIIDGEPAATRSTLGVGGFVGVGLGR